MKLIYQSISVIYFNSNIDINIISIEFSLFFHFKKSSLTYSLRILGILSISSKITFK